MQRQIEPWGWMTPTKVGASLHRDGRSTERKLQLPGLLTAVTFGFVVEANILEPGTSSGTVKRVRGLLDDIFNDPGE